MSIYGTLYKITNTINNKSYIGQTTQGIKKKYHGESLEHIYKYICNNSIKREMEKYGLDAFKLTPELDVASSKEELDEKQEYYKILYDTVENGYNKSYKSTGFQSGEKHPSSTPVILLNTMKLYESMNKASNDTGVMTQNIYACCQGIQRSAGEDENGNRLIWRYAHELDVCLEGKELEMYIDNRVFGEKIYCLNDGTSYNTRQEVCKKYDIPKIKLSRNLRNITSGCESRTNEKYCFVNEYKYLILTKHQKEEMIIKANIDYHNKHKWFIHVESKNVYAKTKNELSKILGISRPTLNTRIKNGEFMIVREYENKYGEIYNIWNFITEEKPVKNINKK